MRRIVVILLIGLSLFGSKIFAQDKLYAELDTTQIRYGEPIEVTIDIPSNVPFRFITDLDSLSNDIVLLDTLTLKSEGDTEKGSFKITSFEEGEHTIPPIFVALGLDTISTLPLEMKVIEFKKDTVLESEIYDIQPLYEPKYKFFDWLIIPTWVWITLVLLIIWALIIRFIIYLRNKYFKDDVIEDEKVLEIKIEPREEAIQMLSRIKQKELYQNGEVKEFFSQVSDTLRIYLSRVYNTSTMEVTTSQTIKNLEDSKMEDGFLFDTREFLSLADKVKFAKLNQNEVQCENYILRTQDFITEIDYKLKGFSDGSDE